MIREDISPARMDEFRCNRTLFRGSEVGAYDFIVSFYTQYRALPSIDVVERETGEPFPDVPDSPIQYWADQVRERWAHSYISRSVQGITDLLAGGDIETAKSRLQSIAVGAQAFDLRHRVSPASEYIDEVLQRHANVQNASDILGASFGLEFLDNTTGGAQPGDFVVVVGRPGCLAGDTKLYFSRKKKGSGRWYTVEDAYYKFNGISRPGKNGTKLWEKGIPTLTQSLKGKFTGLHEVADIVYSGEKELFRVTTNFGKSIRVTAEHPFKVMVGGDIDGFKKLCDLSVGDAVLCKAPNKVGGVLAKKRVQRIIIDGLKYYKSGWVKKVYDRVVDKEYIYKRQHRAVLVYEAEKNELSLHKYIRILKHYPEQAEKLWVVPPGFDIHHRDENPKNDDPRNLVMLERTEHLRIHCRDISHIGRNDVREETILFIEKCGVEPTYDIVMEAPYHNYIADGFIVHNTGKTYLLLVAALACIRQGKKVLFLTMEMMPVQIVSRLMALYAGVTHTLMRHGKLSFFACHVLREKARRMDPHNNLVIMPGGLARSVTDLALRVKEQRPDVVFVDGAYMVRPEERTQAKWEKVTMAAEALKKLGIDENIPIIGSYQQGRGAEGKSGGSLGTIGYSDAIGQLASVGIDIDEEDRDAEFSLGMEIPKIVSIIKGREGEFGAVRVIFNMKRMTITQDRVLISREE